MAKNGKKFLLLLLVVIFCVACFIGGIILEGFYMSQKIKDANDKNLQQASIIQELQLTIENIQTENTQLRLDLSKVTNENEDNKALVITLTNNLNQVQTELNQTKEQLEEFKQNNEDLLAENETLSAQITQLENQLVERQNEITRLNALLEAYQQIANETFAIDFYDDDDPSTLLTTKVVRNGNILTEVPTVESTEKKMFKGWSLTKNGELVNFESYVFTEKVTFYAVYDYYYAVSFSWRFLGVDPNLGSFERYDSTDEDYVIHYETKLVKKDTYVEVPEVNVKYYHFNGWKYQNPSEIVVTQDCSYTADLEKMTLEELKWNEIKHITNSSKQDKFFSVGDEKTFTLTNGDILTAVILDFDFDRCHPVDMPVAICMNTITFGLKNLMRMPKYMNKTVTNKGGWENTYMREWLNNEVFEILPSELQTAIVITDKDSELDANGNICPTADKLWLFSETELTGQYMGITGKKYSYFNNHGLAKLMNNGAGDNTEYWLRTSHPVGGERFNTITSTGGVRNAIATANFGVSFGFCI